MRCRGLLGVHPVRDSFALESEDLRQANQRSTSPNHIVANGRLPIPQLDRPGFLPTLRALQPL